MWTVYVDPVDLGANFRKVAQEQTPKCAIPLPLQIASRVTLRYNNIVEDLTSFFKPPWIPMTLFTNVLSFSSLAK